MSQPREAHITCPECGREIEFILWDSINTNEEFAIPDIISGKLFEICCECGYESHVNYPMLFNDMEHGVAIQYTFPDDLEETMKMARLAASMFQRYRVVTSQEKLREKAAIFSAGLDDRIIELMKLLMEANFVQEMDTAADAIFFLLEEEGFSFEIHVGDEMYRTRTMGENAYEEIQKLFPVLEIPDEDDEFIIDRDWVLKKLDGE